MKFKRNIIYKDEGDETTESIKEAYNKSERVLFIKDGRDAPEYNIENESMASLKFIPLLKTIDKNKIVIHPSKFTLLIWQGLLNLNNYGLIIIRLCELKPEFIHAFKMFYMDNNTMSLTKPGVLCFFNCVKEGSHVYFQSIVQQENNENSLDKDSKENLTCFSISFTIPQQLLNYVKVKDVIGGKEGASEGFLERINKIEEESLESAVEFINSKVDINKLSEIETTPTITEQARCLFLKLEYNKIIQQCATEGNVVVLWKKLKTKGDSNVFSLLKTRKEKIKDISTLSTIVIIDEPEYVENCESCEFNKSFEKTFYDDRDKIEGSISPLDDKLIENIDLKETVVNNESRICLLYMMFYR